MRTVPALAIALVLAAPTEVLARSRGSFSLEEAVAVMRATHPLIAAADAAIDAADADAVNAAPALTKGLADDAMLTQARAAYEAAYMSPVEFVDAVDSWRDARLRRIALAAAARLAHVDLGRSIRLRAP